VIKPDDISSGRIEGYVASEWCDAYRAGITIQADGGVAIAQYMHADELCESLKRRVWDAMYGELRPRLFDLRREIQVRLGPCDFGPDGSKPPILQKVECIIQMVSYS